MNLNPLPPQAYTKDTLSKAYLWLLSQPAHIKELATSQDVLISLYLKALRDGDKSLDNPSINNFRKELKSLANMIGEFNSAEASKVQQTINASDTTKKNQTLTQAVSESFTTNNLSQSSKVNSSLNTATVAKTEFTKTSQSSKSDVANTSNSQKTENAQTRADYSNSRLENPMTSDSEPISQSLLESILKLKQINESSLFDQLDEKSLSMIKEAREALNLSSDRETLRLLIRLGYHQAKSIIK